MKQIVLILFFVISLLHAKMNMTDTCKQGNKNDCNDRGVAYGVKGEYIKAFKLYEKACNLDSSTGCSNIGFMYMNGQAVKRDFIEAVKYLKKSVVLGGYNLGAVNLGIIYANGYGKVKADKEKAIKYFELGCTHKDGFSCNYLGTVEHDKKALYYYNLSCKLGNGYGCYNYAQSAYRGQGMKVDINASIYYFFLACDRNIAYACDTLAGIIIRAEGGVLPDRILAQEYWEKACNLGLKSSCNM